MPFAEDLDAWVARQRWYAGKSHTPQLRILDAQPVAGATRYLLMDDASSPPVLYHVPLARVASPAESDAVVARVAEGALVDATREPAYVLGLLGEMGIDPGGATTRVLDGEQSNTSIVVEWEGRPPIILKLFRTLHHGENPDVTIQRALSDAGSPFVPRFLGSVDAAWPDAGRASAIAHGTLAFAQEYLPGSRDGWTVALDAARDGRDFTESARDLGSAVASVHHALRAAFGTTGAGPDAVAATVDGWQRRLATAAAEVPALADRLATIDAAYRAAVDRPWPRLQRIHGDLHLGQVLTRPGGGWCVIDFEGEPLRPMHERATPDFPLRDVAGMLRSFDYAGAVGRGPHPADWAAACRAAFIDAYSAGGSDELDAVLLQALVLDKAVYEATYEARNRPDWLPVPLAGISTALV